MDAERGTGWNEVVEEDDGVADTGVGHADTDTDADVDGGTASRLAESLERALRMDSTDEDGAWRGCGCGCGGTATDKGIGIGIGGMGISGSASRLSLRLMSLRERILRSRSSVDGRFCCCCCCC